jgi:hypothetical protein
VEIHGVNVFALVREAKPSSPPAAIITLLPEMNAPDAKERAVFKFAEVVRWSRDGSYTKVRLVVRGIKALSLAATRPRAIRKAVLVKSDATLFEAPAVRFCQMAPC